MLSDNTVRPVEDFTVYIVMWNLPGCIPEMEPMRFTSLDAAHNALLEEIDSRVQSAEDDDTYTMWHSIWHEIAHGEDRGPFSIMGPDGYVYSISRSLEA